MRILSSLFLALAAWGAEYQAPAGNQAAAPRPGAVSVLPGGRLIEPYGRQYATGPGPFGIAVSPSGKHIITADSGPEWFSLTILEQYEPGRYRLRQVRPPEEGSKEAEKESWRSVHMGVAFSKEDEVFVSEGEEGRVRLIDLNNGKTRQLFELNLDGARDSYPAAMTYDSRRRLLYVADQAYFRVVIIDPGKRRIVGSVPVGPLPFAMALAPDGRRLYVTHVGQFEYKPVPGADVSLARATGLVFPALGWPSADTDSPTHGETASGEVEVPALGDAWAKEADCVGVIDVSNPREAEVVDYLRPGSSLGGASGGRSPSGVVATAERIYVANTHGDSIAVFDAASLRLIHEIELRIPGFETLRGIMPAGLALHRSSGWLLVAEAGINAVGLIDTRRMTVLGHIPTAWYPVDLRVEQDDVYVVNALGHGAGATANKMIALMERFGRFGGALTVFPLPAARDLPRLTGQVLEQNGLSPNARVDPVAYPKEIRHVVLIVKESRSYDEILGDVGAVGGSRADSAPMLARFGRFGSATAAGGGFSTRFGLRNVNVTPNHHAIAVRWSFSDNFYSDASTSVDAHHWLAGVPPNPWTLSSVASAYGGKKSFRLSQTAPGRRSFSENRTSVMPESVAATQTLWHHLDRHGITFRNYGEGFQLAGAQFGEGMEPTGLRLLTNAPMPEVLRRNTATGYPGYNPNIPDQYRADRFIADIQERYLQPGADLPRFLYVYLPNDDMALARPEDGYRFSASYVADNDYALGRVLAFLSTTPWWKQMAVFVTEDEGRGGVDHVNANRVPLMAAGPWIRRSYVSHRNVSFPGLQKTIYRLLGVPPLHLLDAAATDLSDLFTEEPDFSTYEVQAIPPELFVPEAAKPARPR